MKAALFFVIMAFSANALQNGCGRTDNVNRSSTNQNSHVVSTAEPPTVSPTVQNARDGISAEEDRRLNRFKELCKHAPVGNAKADPINGTAPLEVTFDGSASYDPDGTKIIKWEWHFENGQTKEGRLVTYTFKNSGEYGVILYVTDSQGHKTLDCSDGVTDINIEVTDAKNDRVVSNQTEN